MVKKYTFTDINIYKKLEQIQKIEYARKNIINNIEVLNANKNREGKYFS